MTFSFWLIQLLYLIGTLCFIGSSNYSTQHGVRLSLSHAKYLNDYGCIFFLCCILSRPRIVITHGNRSWCASQTPKRNVIRPLELCHLFTDMISDNMCAELISFFHALFLTYAHFCCFSISIDDVMLFAIHDIHFEWHRIALSTAIYSNWYLYGYVYRVKSAFDVRDQNCD